MESVRMAIAMVLTLIASYLIGCANFAIIISKLVYHKDIRDYGSGNAGMTNIARTFGKWPAVACTIGDFLKGTIAALLGHLFVIILGAGVGFDAFPFYGNYLVALGVMLGHCFPVFYGFRGGKGILVSAGVILVLNYRVLLILLVLFHVRFPIVTMRIERRLLGRDPMPSEARLLFHTALHLILLFLAAILLTAAV